jgi:uncharacterized SAM-binding protein YcdF (DUF218 family)
VQTPIDSIVVLGGPELPSRTVTGINLAGQYPLAALLLSGTPKETATMLSLVQHHAHSNTTRVIADHASFSTVDSALWAHAMSTQHQYRHMAVVSSSWHLPRTAAIFRWAFIQSPVQLTFIPTPDAQPPTKRLKFLELGKWAVFCALPPTRTRSPLKF